MKHFAANARLASSLLMATGFALNCGGQTADSAAQSGLGFTGGQTVGSGSTNNTSDVGGAGGTIGQHDDAGMLGGASNPVDAGTTEDAGSCSLWDIPRLIYGQKYNCCYECAGTFVTSTTEIDNCFIQVDTDAVFVRNVKVLVNCILYPSLSGYSLDAGTLLLSADGWWVDYTFDPVRLMFGAALCEQLRAQGSAPIYVVGACCGVAAC